MTESSARSSLSLDNVKGDIVAKVEYRVRETTAHYAESGAFVPGHTTVQIVYGARHGGFKEFATRAAATAWVAARKERV